MTSPRGRMFWEVRGCDAGLLPPDDDGFAVVPPLLPLLGFAADGAGRFGIYSVPFDGYLARLHKSESVLNAEESAIWRNIRQGGFSTDDLESLGGVIQDNTRGGDVYLDGRKVGSVINARQAQSYRQLQRSGWTV